MQIVLATNNSDKIVEIKQLLDDLPITLLCRDDFLEFLDPDETGDTLIENAILKAKAIAEFTDLAALADDSGLDVDALNGQPGVHSSRFAGEGATYLDNCDKLLRELNGVPPDKRTARFRCVVAICWEGDDISTVEGMVEGIITNDKSGQHGFGYDPVFYYPPLNKRFSELRTEQKNRISHRGHALSKARDLIIHRLARESIE